MKDYFDHIEDYVNGRLLNNELSDFEAAMQSDASLRQAVADHDVAMSMLDGLIESEIREVLEKDSSGSADSDGVEGEEGSRAQKKSKKARNLPIWVGWSLTAIAICALAFFLFTTSNDNSQELQYADIYQEPNWPIQRGGDTDAISEAVSQYLEGNTLESIEQLEAIGSDESQYWLSELYFKEKEWSKVGESLASISSPTSKIRRDMLNYLDIMSLYFDGKKEDSRSKIQKLPADTDSFYMEIYGRM